MLVLPLTVSVSASAAPRADSSVQAVSAHATPGGKISALISDKTFALAQAANVRVSFKLRRTSYKFAYALERRQGPSWIALRSVTKKGRFKGNHTLSLAKIFGSTPIALGNYRLRLSSDANRVLLQFAVIAVQPITGATAINAGGRLTCASFSGHVSCWGFNQDGELGNGTTSRSLTPVPVNGITTATSIDVGYRHACAVLSAGALTCWGYNALGELGNGTVSNSSVPLPVHGLAGVVGGSSSAAGACAVLTGGAIKCWGDNETGELGVGTITGGKPYGVAIPVLVVAISNATAVSGGLLHTCALISGGTVDCWGYNQDGQVGNGTISSQRPFAVPTPVQVTGLTNAVTISAGDFHTCALLPDGSVDCWGYIASSEIAGLPLLNNSTPIQIAGIHNAIAVSSGGFHSCALISDGTVRCWGENHFGELGNGTEIDSSVPVTVAGINDAVAIDLGSNHSCAVLGGGAVKCWGDNQYGQLGDGTTNQSSTPVSVVSPS